MTKSKALAVPTNEHDVRMAEIKAIQAQRLTKPQRDELTKLFHMRFRRAPVSQCKKLLTTSVVAADLQAEIAEMPEYKAALKAVLKLSQAIATKYEVDAAPIAVHSKDEVLIVHDSTDYHGNATDVVNMTKRRRNVPIQEYNAQFEAAEKKAKDAYELEKQEKLTVIRTANTIEQVLLLVPECQVNLPTPTDRELMARNGYQPGQLSAGEVLLEAEVTK